MLEFSTSNLFGSAGMNPNQANSSVPASLMNQFGRSNSTSSGNSMFSLLGASGAGIGPPPTLDLNEFPSLGGSNIASFVQASTAGRTPYVGLLKDNSNANAAVTDFNLQQEEFPALPGAPIGGGAPQPPQSTTPTTASLQAAFQSQFGNAANANNEVVVNRLASLSQQFSAAAGVLSSSNSMGGSGSGTSGSANGGQPNASSSSGTGNTTTSSSSTNPRPESTDSSQTQSSSGAANNSQVTSSGGGGSTAADASSGTSSSGKKLSVQLTKDGQLANIPPGMLTDAYGMAGLVALLANTESNQNLFSLAIGYDISSINLNLNSKERIYQTYPGPWNEKQLKPYEIDYPVPSEYLIHHNIRDKISDIKPNQYSDDLLFFLFYFFAGEQMQLLATNVLHTREWRYHKDEGVWICRQGAKVKEQTATYERGSYIYFDPHNWCKMQKEFTIEYERLDSQPSGFQ